ncbi:MAG: transposase [Nitrospira sp.]|nr:MAG: transposase [Nitrospira sp.]
MWSRRLHPPRLGRPKDSPGSRPALRGQANRPGGGEPPRRRPLWFGGKARSEERRDACSQWLGPSKRQQIRLAVLDRWQAFRHSTRKPEPAPQAALLCDPFHGIRHRGTAVDTGRKPDYDRLTGKERRFINGQQYTRLSHRENLKPAGRTSRRRRLKANRRLHTASRLQEAVGRLWDDEREGWARRFFEHWRESRKWQRLKPYEKFAEMIDRHWDGIAAACQPENTVA